MSDTTLDLSEIRNNHSLLFQFKRSSCDTLRFVAGFFFHIFFRMTWLYFCVFGLIKFTRVVHLHNNKSRTRYQIRNHSQRFSDDFLRTMHIRVAQSPVLANDVTDKEVRRSNFVSARAFSIFSRLVA